MVSGCIFLSNVGSVLKKGGTFTDGGRKLEKEGKQIFSGNDLGVK